MMGTDADDSGGYDGYDGYDAGDTGDDCSGEYGAEDYGEYEAADGYDGEYDYAGEAADDWSVKEAADGYDYEYNYSSEVEEDCAEYKADNEYDGEYDYTDEERDNPEEVVEEDDADDVPGDWDDAGRDPTLTLEQLEIVQEMELYEEMDIMPSEMGTLKTGGAYDRTEQINVDMHYNPEASYDVESFIEQTKLQEDGLNDLTVSDFLENYENRLENGRSPEGKKAQAQYNDGLEVALVDEKLQMGLSPKDAEREAAEELSGMAALHNPDQIAGGHPTVVTALGDSDVNSALGSLWGHGRAEELYNKVSRMAENMTQEQRDTTYLDVRIHIHPD